MNFQINTKAKTITLEENVNIFELLKVLKAWMPNGEWKSYQIAAVETSIGMSPIIIDRPFWYDRPFWLNPVTYITNDQNIAIGQNVSFENEQSQHVFSVSMQT